MSDYVSIYSSSLGIVRHGAISLSESNKPFFAFRLEPAAEGNVYDNAQGYTFDGIITEFNIDKSEVIALTPTLGSDLYLYVGGESAWEIILGGIAFTDCERTDQEGFRNILDFYCMNNVSRTGKPCKLIMGKGTSYKAYLTAFRFNSVKKLDGVFPFLFKFYAVRAD